MIIDEHTFVHGIWHGEDKDPLNLPHVTQTYVLYRHGDGPWLLQIVTRLVVDHKYCWDNSADQKYFRNEVLEGKTEEQAVTHCQETIRAVELSGGLVFDFLEVKGGPEEFIKRSHGKPWLGRLTARRPLAKHKQN